MTLEELSHLDYQGAMDMLFAYTTDIKRHEKDVDALRKEIEIWSSRVKLAEGKGMTELAEAAKTQVSQLNGKIAEIDASRAELVRDAQRIKESLSGIKAKERSIDPDLLQAELSMMTGEALDPEKAKLERELSALESAGAAGEAGAPAEDALTALKRKMGLASDTAPGKPDAKP
jgi:chromosome segregation ATPase